MLDFRKALPSEAEFLKELTKNSVKGVISFSFLMTAGEGFHESFFVGTDENGFIKSIVFDTGNEYFSVYGEEKPEILSLSDKTVMIYDNKTAVSGCCEELHGREILGVFALLSGEEKPSFDDERRYVLRLRAKNSGVCEVFGIKENGALISTASVSSMNDSYALISDVFTRVDKRNKGYAHECVMSAVSFSLRNGKIPVLLCEEKMCDYYKKAGFKIYGKM